MFLFNESLKQQSALWFNFAGKKQPDDDKYYSNRNGTYSKDPGGKNNFFHSTGDQLLSFAQ